MIETMYRIALAMKDFHVDIDPELIKKYAQNWLKDYPNP
jgi:hypothetical protein